MTARKPAPATEPVVAPDTAWGNVVTSTRDGAVTREQSLRNDRLAREEFYERERLRLQAECSAELASLDGQITQQINIIASCDAALKSLSGEESNVVALKPAAA